MRGGELQEVVRRLRSAVRPGQAGGLDDGELLRRWVADRDEAAFEVLVWRHGPLVLGACRRLLRDPQEVEDAFQATWLALVRRARSIRRHGAVGSWLYKVACRVALRARAAASRRPAVSSYLPDMPEGVQPGALEKDLRAVLDEEVSRLPEKYRAPMVLCYFGGRTNEEAARELGRPVGTIVSRLVRARQRLRGRLARRGVSLGATALAMALSQNAAPAMVSGVQVGTAVRAAALAVAGKGVTGAVSSQAAALAEGVVRTMLVTKVKAGVVVVLGALLLGGGGAYTYRSRATEPATANQVAPPAPDRAARRAEDERLRKLLAERDFELKKLLDEKEAQLQLMKAREAAMEAELKTAQARIAEMTALLDKARNLRIALAPDPKVPPPPLPTAPANRVTTDRLMQAQEDMELLEVQLEIKQAYCQAAEKALVAARQHAALIEDAVRRAPGSIPVAEVAKAREEVAAQEALLAVKRAELKEPQLRLAQAKRRLVVLGKESSGADAAPPDAWRQDLIKRLDALAKELDALRREVQHRR